MGKWDGFKGKLTEYDPAADLKGEKLAKWHELMGELKSLSTSDLALDLMRTKEHRATLKAANSAASFREDVLCAIFHERSAEENMPSFRVDGVGLVTPGIEPYASLPNKVKAIAWLKEAASTTRTFVGLVKEDVNAKQLNAEVKQQLESGFDVPDLEESGIKVFLKRTLSFRKEKAE